MTTTHQHASPEAALTPCNVLGELVDAHCIVIDQLIDACHSINTRNYCAMPAEGISPLGMHIRHIIEFYQELTRVLDHAVPDIICYDNRQRNMLLENSPHEAVDTLEHIKEVIRSHIVNDRQFILQAILCVGQAPTKIASSLYRECHYVLDHAIHHMAMIKMIAGMMGVSLPDSFGVAYSTQSHRNTQAA